MKPRARSIAGDFGNCRCTGRRVDFGRASPISPKTHKIWPGRTLPCSRKIRDIPRFTSRRSASSGRLVSALLTEPLPSRTTATSSGCGSVRTTNTSVWSGRAQAALVLLRPHAHEEEEADHAQSPTSWRKHQALHGGGRLDGDALRGPVRRCPAHPVQAVERPCRSVGGNGAGAGAHRMEQRRVLDAPASQLRFGASAAEGIRRSRSGVAGPERTVRRVRPSAGASGSGRGPRSPSAHRRCPSGPPGRLRSRRCCRPSGWSRGGARSRSG